jgi:hypothetical protein
MKRFKFLKEEMTIIEEFFAELISDDNLPAEHELYRVLNVSIDYQRELNDFNPVISPIIFRIYRNETQSYSEAHIKSITNRVIELWDSEQINLAMRQIMSAAWMTVDIEAEKCQYISQLIIEQEFREN